MQAELTMTVFLLPGVIADPPFIRTLCRRPYPDHPRGCPNHGRRATCPPAAPCFNAAFDARRPVYAIVNEFDLAGHVERLRARHPDWTERQLHNCLYWQPAARRQLRKRVRAFLAEHPDLVVTGCPEAMGVDVTATLAAVGIELEWPPRKIARQVALAGTLRGEEWGT